MYPFPGADTGKLKLVCEFSYAYSTLYMSGEWIPSGVEM